MIEPTEVELDEILLVGLSTETTQAELTNTTPAIWQRAGELQLDKKIQHVKDPNVTLECQFDRHATNKWTYMLALEVTEQGELPLEAVFYTVPASKWLAFDLPGQIPNVDVVGAWDDIIEWFKTNNRMLPFHTYIQRFDENTGKAQNMLQL